MKSYFLDDKNDNRAMNTTTITNDSTTIKYLGCLCLQFSVKNLQKLLLNSFTLSKLFK